MSRDWTQTLFLASFKGAPFWVKQDGEDGGRRLDVVDIPGADAPFIEDLGARRNVVEIHGYFIGDVSDVQMTALEAVCNQAGAGVLVLPAQGPVTARCESVKRSRERDQMGRFGFDARFVLDPRSGFAGPQAALPADYLAQLAFDAGDQLGVALSGMLSGFQV